MDNKTLATLFAESLFQIPDYQRGYAWEPKQWKDFIQDIDALVEDDYATSHYTGTVVVFADKHAKVLDYGTDRLKVVHVVDGQQRLTTSCLYLSVIIRALCNKNESAFERKIPDFLYSGAVCKVTLNNDTAGIFYDLLKYGCANTSAQSPHEKRLIAAHAYFKQHINEQLAKRNEQGIIYLKQLYGAITRKLHFTFYEITEECEVGMTFELMNSRGKDLSVLELLKNYLMHWVSRNTTASTERNTLTALINKHWKDTYTNLGSCDGDEDQCLRIAWTLYCDHSPANWIGYDGFKGDNHIPLRNFEKRTKADVQKFIGEFTTWLAVISRHYAIITKPTRANTFSHDEMVWLTKIHNTWNIANFLPLMVAARIRCEKGSIEKSDYRDLLKALECYAYRVFLFEGRRSNAGKSNFYSWSSDVFAANCDLRTIVNQIHHLVRYYASEESFVAKCAEPTDWYARRNLLRYTLFEYELERLDTEGKGKAPLLAFDQLNDSTIEHILPQNPGNESHWKKVWSADEMKRCLHDIGNLVLTQNNSNYRNFDFARKRGSPGISPSYCDSDIRQERKISNFSDWTPKEFKERRSELVTWIIGRWKSEGHEGGATLEVIDVADEDKIGT